jgi:hypothetical protein
MPIRLHAVSVAEAASETHCRWIGQTSSSAGGEAAAEPAQIQGFERPRDANLRWLAAFTLNLRWREALPAMVRNKPITSNMWTVIQQTRYDRFLAGG